MNGELAMPDKHKSTINRERALLDFALPCDYATMTEFIEIMRERYEF